MGSGSVSRCTNAKMLTCLCRAKSAAAGYAAALELRSATRVLHLIHEAQLNPHRAAGDTVSAVQFCYGSCGVCPSVGHHSLYPGDYQQQQQPPGLKSDVCCCRTLIDCFMLSNVAAFQPAHSLLQKGLQRTSSASQQHQQQVH